MSTPNLQNEDIRLLLKDVYQEYGYDFRNYSKASVKRRILSLFSKEQFDSIQQMHQKVLQDVHLFNKLLLSLSINTTEMFRDPLFYKAVRAQIIPILKTYPSIKIWHAGCSSGEEVYSMAILLTEEKIYDKAMIYATDFNPIILKKAKEGVFSIDSMKHNTSNYQKAGGLEAFSDYYTSNDRSVIMRKSLKKNIVFAEHDLTVDQVFSEIHMVICRNVFIYFNRELQSRVFGLFYDSLVHQGILCLGSKETVKFSDYAEDFKDVCPKEKIYRKKTFTKL